MASTYRAVEVSTPGVLRVVERPISKPAAGQVRLRVEACGVCHSDLATVQGDYPGLKLPRVPGHEVVGRIEEIGPNVSKWKIGQRVGVGFLGGQDGECEPCLRGDFADCLNPVISGITTDGGYAEVMIAEARALASIPDELTSEDAAPLLCAGITTFNALRNASLRAGDLVGRSPSCGPASSKESAMMFVLPRASCLKLSHFLAPVLPKRFHVNPAPKIAQVLVDAVVTPEPGCHFKYSDSLV